MSMSATLPFEDGDVYTAPYPPRLNRPPVLRYSLIAAVAAVNICAAGMGLRWLDLSNVAIAPEGASAAVALPDAKVAGRLAVLDAPDEAQAPPLQLADLKQQAHEQFVAMRADLYGEDAAGVVDAIDHANDVAVDTPVTDDSSATEEPAPICFNCGRTEAAAQQTASVQPIEFTPPPEDDDAYTGQN